MNINYYAQTDSIYIDLSSKPSVESQVVSDDLVIDFGEHGEPVGIDIQHASKILNLSELVTHNIPTKKISWKVWDAEKLITHNKPAEAVSLREAEIDIELINSLAHPSSCVRILRETENMLKESNAYILNPKMETELKK